MFNSIQPPTGGGGRDVSGGNFQNGYTGGGGGGFLDTLGGIASLVAPFTGPAAPWVAAGGSLLQGNLTGAAQSAAGGLAQGGQEGTTDTGDPQQPPPQYDDYGNDQNPPELYTEQKLDNYADEYQETILGPNGMPMPIQEYYKLLYMQNPYMLLHLMGMPGMEQQNSQYMNNGPGGIFPNQGFDQFNYS